jgi:hypothetical protein
MARPQLLHVPIAARETARSTPNSYIFISGRHDTQNPDRQIQQHHAEQVLSPPMATSSFNHPSIHLNIFF